MRFGDDGRLYAINPEAGFFGVAPGTGDEDQRQRDQDAVGQLHLHQRRADRRRRRLVGGLTDEAPAHLIDWKGNDWTPDSDEPSRHPNARFTAPAEQCPSIAPNWEDPAGCADLGDPVRRPPRHERAAGHRGLRLGARCVHRCATVASERPLPPSGHGRAAPRPLRDAAVLRLQHGRLLGSLAQDRRHADADKLPKVYQVNWFRKDEDGKFIWPGFGENSRVLAWIIERVEGRTDAEATAIGGKPKDGDLYVEGLDLTDEQLTELFAVDPETWLAECDLTEEYFAQVR
jgi:phosphoenolpyruvate carboxykinase (GTP)